MARNRLIVGKKVILDELQPKYFEDIIKQSYGKKSEDGKRFIKDPKDFEEFAQTEAYVNLFMELATNSDAAANFVNGIIPQGLK